MPPHVWASDPLVEIRAFETRRSSAAAGALFSWAVWTIDSLHYLDDVDRSYDRSHQAVGGHRPDVVDVAHARWSTSTCVTAIDLCAAGLGRAFCGNQGTNEFDLGGLVSVTGSRRAARESRRAAVPQLALTWLDAVQGDPQYSTVKAARDWLTHSRLRRHFTLQTGGPPQRLRLELTSQMPVRTVIVNSIECGTRHVTDFLRILPAL